MVEEASAAVPSKPPRLPVGAAAAGWAVSIVANAQRIDVVPCFNDLRPYYQVAYTGAGALLSAHLLGYVLAQIPMGRAPRPA